MSAAQASPKTMARKAWIAVRFILFGLVGFGGMLLFTGEFALRVFGHHRSFVSPFLSLPLGLAGAVMMLYGTGQWGRWAYLWVFLSIPISFCLCILLPGADNSKDASPVILAGIVASFIYVVVKLYYARGVPAEPAQDGNNS